MSENELYKKVEKRADEKISFYHHLYSFISVNIIFILMNAILSPGEWWFYWITVFWGIGLIIHFLKVFVFVGKLDDNYREKMIEKEMEKMKKYFDFDKLQNNRQIAYYFTFIFNDYCIFNTNP